jgi:hypothetical protein
LYREYEKKDNYRVGGFNSMRGDFAYVGSFTLRDTERRLFTGRTGKYLHFSVIECLKEDLDRLNGCIEQHVKTLSQPLHIRVGDGVLSTFTPGVNKGNVAYTAFCDNIVRMIKRGELTAGRKKC